MLFKKILRNRHGVSDVISTILITSIMLTSIALTYVYIIPTIDRGRMNADMVTTTLFLSKIDGTIQSMLYDGQGAARVIDIDAFIGDLDFRRYGINFRAFINGAMYLPIPAIEYGAAKLTITTDTAIIQKNQLKYLKGSPYDPIAITNEGSIDPAVITLERFTSDQYFMELYYRLFILIRDTGTGGTIDVTIFVINFDNAESIRGINSGAYSLSISKKLVEANPTRYGFNVNGDPITTSGSNFYITLNKNTGPYIIYRSTGLRTRVSINLVISTFDFIAQKID